MVRQPAYPTLKPPLVEGTDLFQQDKTIAPESRLLGAHRNVNRKTGLAPLGRDGRHDHGGAVLVADIVLKDEDRPYSALFGAHNGRKVGKKDVAAPDSGFYSPGGPIRFHASSASWTFS